MISGVKYLLILIFVYSFAIPNNAIITDNITQNNDTDRIKT